MQRAIANGVPLVVAGRTEDKAEVGARVAWSGVGVNLRTQRPSPEAVRAAVERVLGTPSYAARARELARRRHRRRRRGGLWLLSRLAEPTSRS